jgi:superfamily II DNA or RNA helicase/DNA-binding XRE family transcriptional regulator
MQRFSSERQVPPDFPSRVKQVRERLGLSQARFAGLLGVSTLSVKKWEQGQSTPFISTWQQIVQMEQSGLNDHTVAAGVLRDPQVAYQAAPPTLDFTSRPEVVRAVVEAHRLSYGHLSNPAFATEISLIEPLPHQRLAVYERMLQQSRLRYLLADDAGAGKTIMAGLYIREMLSRRLIQRILIVPPAGLVGNWERELRTLFSLSFRIVGGNDLRQSNNPFLGPESHLLIVSLDTLAGKGAFVRLQDQAVAPYDLVIFDEAHKLAADRDPDIRLRRTDRYCLAEALAGIASDDQRWELPWRCQHLLLLTATPHMGKDYPYYCLWRLLEPEALSTIDAFNAYPPAARRQHFLRRTKEEMVYLDNTPIYPTRISDTLSYDLTQGEISEQQLYDDTTRYIQTYYNRARLLNRSAARLAMSVFQRRLASSTYALLRSLERRHDKLDLLIERVQQGLLDLQRLAAEQQRLDTIEDPLDEMTADEEQAKEGEEENEAAENDLLSGVAAHSLGELQTELGQVAQLLVLARQVFERSDEAKFEKLREILRDPQYAGEKFLLFTEHRDTLTFLVQRLEGLGFTGQIAQIHGGMDYLQREQQVALFCKPLEEGGARYLIATDAAGEGINLQFCWLMLNYDIPWNPARLEQRMGRIHRFGQKHNPVIILNLVAGKTREGRVLRTLLEKLERIRRELGTDKVFDVVGRLFEGISLRQYMEQATTETGANQATREIERRLTKEQVQAIRAREQHLYGDDSEVRSALPRLHTALEQEVYHRLLPGSVRRFIEKAAPLLQLGIEGDLERTFTFRALRPGTLDFLWPILERATPEQQAALTVYRPARPDLALFLHPGEPVFERIRLELLERFQFLALQGAVFIDPSASNPALLHIAQIGVIRRADSTIRVLNRPEVLEQRMIGLIQAEDGTLEVCPVERLLLLQDGQGVPPQSLSLVARSDALLSGAQTFAEERVAERSAEQHREMLRASLEERERFIKQGYAYQEAELAEARNKLREKANAGDAHARGELTRIKERQQTLEARKAEALAILRREIELIVPGPVTFLAHALIVPSSDPEDQKRQDARVEALAMQYVRTDEEARGALVKDVSLVRGARAAGLQDHPGFDLLSIRPTGEERAIEVKGRAAMGGVELTENEWVHACNLGERYWLYVVYDCASAYPRLLRISDPFRKLIAKAKGSVMIDQSAIMAHAEEIETWRDRE